MDDSFFDSVYKVVIQIPKGRVTTYGAIARYLGAGKSSRMVGWAMNSSFSSKMKIPAHRVVNRNGQLTGKHHFGGDNTMAELLLSEGITVIKDQIINFNEFFWNPEIELS